MTNASIPTRSQIAEADTWDLAHLFLTEEDYRTAFEAYKAAYPKLGEYKGRLSRSAKDLLECLEFDKSLDLIAERLGHYASLKIAEDGSNHENLARRAELTNLLTRAHEVAAFLTPEIQRIPDDVFDQYLMDPVLADWRIRLIKIRRFRPHTLSEMEERLLAAGASVVRGHDETFSQLTNVDMKFGTVSDKEGVEVALSQSTYISLLHRTDRELRRKAFHQFFQEFEDHRYTLASALAASTRADVFYAKVRNYPSCRESSLFSDNIPVEVYENLISTVRAHLPALHDYYDLRKEVLKLDKIHQYDTFVPLVPALETNIPFDEAISLVANALEPLGNNYVEPLRSGLRSRWVDRYETKGKRSGAFSSSSYRNPPFILMNYKADVFSDVFTLAHEVGHSMHTWFSQSHQLFQNYDYPIFLAEVASMFNEQLLTHSLLEKADDPAMRAYLIDRQVEDIRSALFRQTMFAEFEKRTHQVEEDGGPLTLDTFQRIYRELLEAYFGPRFVIDPQLEVECLRIPHFYSAFYVYKYATGISAAISLAHRVLNGGTAEIEAYLGFLKSGGSRFPIETLLNAGIDVRTPEPIERAIELFADRVKELRRLLLDR